MQAVTKLFVLAEVEKRCSIWGAVVVVQFLLVGGIEYEKWDCEQVSI